MDPLAGLVQRRLLGVGLRAVSPRDRGRLKMYAFPLIVLGVAVALLGVHLAMPAARSWVWKVLALFALGMFAAQPYLALVWAPPEREMGDVYRIIYMHVPQV